MRKKGKIFSWKKIHKWVGLVSAIFILLFCASGIILNHRALFAPYSVSRAILPGSYHIKDFNNGVVKATVPYGDRLLAYGNVGIWLTDKEFSNFTDFNNGLPEGVDSRNIRKIVQAPDGTLWCAAQFGLYRLENGKWSEAKLPGNSERLADVAIDKESGRIVALTRSAVYLSSGNGFVRKELEAPKGYANKVTLFKTIWHLHSGDLFGLGGKIVVDLIAIVLIFLSLTAIVLFILPYSIRRAVKAKVASRARLWKWNFKWHSKIGYYTIILTILIAVTGMSLRPPLMIPFVLIKTGPVPGSTFDSENVWKDKLRAVSQDADKGKWLISTSEGFLYVDKEFAGKPELLDAKGAPPVSPMGVNVLEPLGEGNWLVGSFSGLYIWNPEEGSVRDYFTKAPYTPAKGGRPISDHLVAGYSKDLGSGESVFDYAKGVEGLGKTPEILSKQPMSLWNFALELHVGRCYSPVLGPLSSLFVFFSGALLTIVLISGLIIHNRHKKKHNINKQKEL